MKTQTLNALIGAMALTLVVGCSDPADNVSQATVGSAADTSANAVPTGKAYVISSDSKIGFVGSKVTGSHDGGFNEFSGNILIADGAIAPGSKVTIDMDSLWSDNDRLTGHLKNADFFEVETYPESVFEVTSSESTADGVMLTGNLTLHGVTKSIQIPATVAVDDSTVKLNSEFSINRFDFGIAYKGAADDLIRDRVVIKLDVTANAEG